MSALFSVRVAKVSEKSAELSVVSIHPDSGPPQPTPTFALMLLYDVISNCGYTDFKKWTHIEGSPLAQEMDMTSFLDEGWIRKNARAFVASVKKKKGGVLEVVPTHPAWISHLRRGMSFETASYSAGPGEDAEPRGPQAASEGPAPHSRNPSEGFRVGKTRAEDYQKLGEVFIPLFGASRYAADPVITDPKAIEEAAKKMLGQPALVVPHRGPASVGVIVDLGESWASLYYEDAGGGGWGSSGTSYSEIKSFGRAWLKERALPNVLEAKPAAAAPATRKKKTKVAAKKAKKPAAKPKKKKR